jgi:DNA-binding response OmpR family regulator
VAKEFRWKRLLSRLFRTQRGDAAEKRPSETTQVLADVSLDPPGATRLGEVVVCTPSAHLVANWVKEVVQRGYRSTVIETLSPTMERIAAASPDAILIDPGDQPEAAIRLVTLLRKVRSLQSRFVGAIAHLPDEMRVIAKPLLEAGASRVFQPTPARAAQILIGLKIALTPGRFEKVLTSGAKTASRTTAGPSNERTILILEANPTVANILKEMLEDHGFTIEIALDAETALQALNQTQPQAFLLDTFVPGLPGTEVLKQIRALEKFRQTPIVVSTSGFSAFSEKQLLDAGATRVFYKPETGPQKILEIFEELLGPAGLRKSGPGRESLVDASRATATELPGAEATARPATSDGDKAFFAEIQESLLQEAPVLVRDLQEALDALNREASAENFSRLDRKLHAVVGNAGLARLTRVGSLASAAAALVEDLQAKAGPLSNSVRKTLSQAVLLMGELFGQADEFMPAKVAVMAVDDEEVSRRVLTHALGKVDLRPEVFGSPAQALKQAQDSQFELIFLDVDMPEMDGFELCKKIRALPQYADTPVVFITSRDSLEAYAESARSGGSDFINKPFAIRELAVKALIYLLQKRGEETLKTP